MINSKLILANAPSNMGEQIHINHVDCEAGLDKKKRLYIKRVEKGLLAYCHHCNQSGFVPNTNSERLSNWFNKKEQTNTTKDKPVIASLTMEGAVWLHKYYCNIKCNLFNGIAGEPNKVALTLQDPQQQPIGWQIRNLTANATPKYITHYTNNSKGEASWFHDSSKTLVITEDYLSAYRINNDTGFSSVALLRTAISDKTLNQIYELDFEYVLIWLDPDEAGTIGATKAYKKLKHFLPDDTKLILLGMDKEPKQCTPQELNSLLS